MTAFDDEPGESAAVERNPYPLPLYLNQKYVFDVLSMMERGFSQLETVTTRRGEEQERGGRFSGDVGFSNVFGLLNVKLGAGRTRAERHEGGKEVATERVHTPNSLFARMRERLFEEGLVERSLVEETPAAGMFVEMAMRLEKNPLVETLETLVSILRLATIFEEHAAPSGGGGRHQGQGQRRAHPKSESEQMLGQMSDLLTQLNTGQVIDLIATPTAELAPQVVLTLDTAYATDPTLSDLIDGEYSVLGKVTRFIPEGDAETLNLLRKTSLGRLQASLLDGLRAPLEEAQQGGIDLPAFQTEIEPPIVQLLPIAVFA
jgi:hypothetical protein